MFLFMTTPPTRTRNPRGQGELLRTALMGAARDLLLELGDQDKLSVRAVTARAGVSPNALYLHFSDKDALLSAVMIANYKELRAFLHAAIPPDANPIEQLRALGLAYLEFAAQRPGIYRVLFMTKVREGVPVPAPGAVSGQDEGVDAFNDLLEIVERCLPNEPEPFAQAAYFWAGLHGFVALNQVIPAFPWPSGSDYVERMIRVHIRADTH
jgi:AcrR family transcriptional regulator